jgi:hypothetical protein
VTEVALLCVVLAQQIYWARQVHKLVDKLMSRNFYDYQISSTLKPREPKAHKVTQDEFFEDTSASLQII